MQQIVDWDEEMEAAAELAWAHLALENRRRAKQGLPPLPWRLDPEPQMGETEGGQTHPKKEPAR